MASCPHFRARSRTARRTPGGSSSSARRRTTRRRTWTRARSSSRTSCASITGWARPISLAWGVTWSAWCSRARCGRTSNDGSSWTDPEPLSSENVTVQPHAPLLRCTNVCVRFGGIAALDGVSFDVQKGQIVGVIGPNGAGKTTLFNCISRLYPVHSGEILFEGKLLLSQPRHRIADLGIARTFQNVALFDTLSVVENVMLGAHGRSRRHFLADALHLPSSARADRELAREAEHLL